MKALDKRRRNSSPERAPLPPPSGGEAPLSENETKKDNILSLLGDNNKLNDLFDYDKAQQNIYEIENKLKDILNQ